jgi:hypothetical protein
MGEDSGLLRAGFVARLHGLAMQSWAIRWRHGDGPLWGIALGLSLLANSAIFIGIGLASVESAKFAAAAVHEVVAPSAPVALIFPQVAATAARLESAEALESAAVLARRFARTSADQEAPRPKAPVLFGERDTQATSNRAPDPSAPALPSQAGIAPRHAMDLETTESDYKDGSLDSQALAAPKLPTPEPAAETTVLETAAPAEPESAPASQVREKSPDGPNPVDVLVPRETAKQDKPPVKLPRSPYSTRRENPPEPGFAGLQRKTAVTGSISRSGSGALDVEDSPLGRYQAALSRAVEQEWQRNCVRHRDFITPGFLTVRFFVEPGGKVRSVQFVGDMETGEVQKGFTLNSIRDAAIPKMPATLRKQYDKEPLELVFRFYF